MNFETPLFDFTIWVSDWGSIFSADGVTIFFLPEKPHKLLIISSFV